MKEPFYIVPYDKELDMPNFRISRLAGCPESYAKDLTAEIAKEQNNPELDESLIIEDSTNIVFDDGNYVHYEREILNAGAKRIINSEKGRKIVHIKNYFSVTGHPDVEEGDWIGLVIKDYKSTKHEEHNKNRLLQPEQRLNRNDGFLWFLLDGHSEYHTEQLSGYAYMIYVDIGVYYEKGIIEKIDKKNPRNYLGLEGSTMPLTEARVFLLTHPVIHWRLGRLPRDKLQLYAIQKLKKYVNASGTCWMCENITTQCQYRFTCAVRNEIEKVQEDV